MAKRGGFPGMGMPGNMNNLMKQAQKMQRQMEENPALLSTGNIVTVHSVHSNVAKIHSRLPAAMEFWLVCLGILAYSCQNTSRDSGV